MSDKKTEIYKKVYKVTGEGFKLKFESEGKTELLALNNAIKIASEIVECLEEFINYGEFRNDEED
jgi:hypothetical protein